MSKHKHTSHWHASGAEHRRTRVLLPPRPPLECCPPHSASLPTHPHPLFVTNPIGTDFPELIGHQALQTGKSCLLHGTVGIQARHEWIHPTGINHARCRSSHFGGRDTLEAATVADSWYCCKSRKVSLGIVTRPADDEGLSKLHPINRHPEAPMALSKALLERL